MTARRLCAHSGLPVNVFDDAFRNTRPNRNAFIKLLKSEHGMVHEFRRMNQLDILGPLQAQFRAHRRQMQHDLFHAYTVDQHILQVLRNLRRFTMSEFAHEYPLCSRLVDEFSDFLVTLYRSLFHDIAKGHSMGIAPNSAR